MQRSFLSCQYFSGDALMRTVTAWWLGQAVDRSVDRSIDQSINQPLNQPINQVSFTPLNVVHVQ
jgi:hypothetical protein